MTKYDAAWAETHEARRADVAVGDVARADPEEAEVLAQLLRHVPERVLPPPPGRSTSPAERQVCA